MAELQARFPRMKPVRGAPPLFRLNGCGTAMFGSRNFDAHTGTYLKTYGLTLVFIPVLPFACYRVADAQEGGWYFLGKEPISGFARMARATVILGIIAAVAFAKFSADWKSPEAIVNRGLAAAAETAEKSGALDAAIQAHALAKLHPTERDRCIKAMAPYLDKALAAADGRTVLGAIDLVVDSPFRESTFGGRIEALGALALARSETHLDDDPRLAREFAARARKLDDGATAAWVKPMKAALEALVRNNAEADAADIELLAELYDELGETGAILALLESRAPFPAGNPLSMRLGRALLREGRPAEAARHLADFTDTRFPEWQARHARLVEARKAAYDRAIENLEKGLAPQTFYEEYDKAGELEREQLVSRQTWDMVSRDGMVLRQEYLLEQLENLPALLMDLGIARLEAGHAAAPESRTDWFRQAEKTFLSLKDHAEDSPDFQFFYGQVCYWLGKSSEGAALFDRLIVEHGEDPALLAEMAGVLRNVGEIRKARDVYQQALEKAGDDAAIKDSCLISLAILAETIDERIGHLEKADAKIPRVAIDLAEARAAKAIDAGDRETARKLYRQALDGYASMPENAVTLNNAALVHFEIASLGGGQAEVAAGLRKLEAAVALEPNDSILCHNAASRFIGSASNAMLTEAIEPEWLAVSGGSRDLRLLYQDEAGRAEILQRFKTHPDYQRGRQLLDRALVLAPENRMVLQDLIGIASLLQDSAALALLRSRIESMAAGAAPITRAEWIDKVNADAPDDIPGELQKLNLWHKEAAAKLTTARAKATQEVRRAASHASLAYWLPDLDMTPFATAVEDAHRQWPCSEFLDVKLDLARIECWRRICRDRPQVAAWAGNSLRMLEADQLLMLAALRFPELLEDAGVRGVFEAGLDYTRRFPNSYTPQDAVTAALLDTSDQREMLDGATRHPSFATQCALMRMEAPHVPSTIVHTLCQQWVAEGRDAALANYRTAAAGHPWLPEIP
jgi:hypothetical protein